ncbi:MAG TPA: hypothetical protein VGS06_29510 [Streptosporangiaceae bacterium]|nr:hypothetical protein [Streptosporangiaceae bacterium]
MLVDVAAYQQEQARCGIDPETGRAQCGARRTTGRCCIIAPGGTAAGAPPDASAAPPTLWDELNVCRAGG